MKKFTILLFVFFVGSFAIVSAQQRTITGTVSDSSNPMPGVFIYEKGIESNATTTGINGDFRIVLRGNSNTLIVKMLGFLEQEVNVAGKSQVSISLKEDNKGLEEVVVVGYGTKKKITQTGAVSQITGEEIRQNPSASLQNTLMGRLPGFASQQVSGQPGADGATFNIRGANSYTGKVNVLVIVDDIEFGQPISDIDPDQVESITILKDASTTAIYGAKGANGVILITTRRGVAGKPRVSFKSETGLQSPTYPFEFLNSFQVATLANQAAANAGEADAWTQEDLDHFKNGTDPYGHPDVNWSDVILRKNSNQVRNNLNISGGTEKAKYFVTLGHLYQNGIMNDFSSDETGFNSNYYYKRYNFRTNVDIQATKTFSLSVDMSGYMGEQNQPWLRGTSNNPFFELNDYKRLPPFAYPIYNPDGSYGGNTEQLARLAYNVVGRMTYLGYERANENGIVTNVTARQDLSFITKGLKVRGVFGYSNANSYSRELKRGAFPSYVYDSENDTYTPFDPATLRLPVMSVGSDPGRMNKRVNMQANLQYENTFNKKHHVNGLVLYNQYSRNQGANIPENFRGFSFRTGYDYQLKYILELSAGYNGSDKFPKQNRYGFFPAASVGWNVAEESFFKNNIKFIDLFKIRASYGIIGDDASAPDPGAYISQIYAEQGGAYNFGESYNSTGNNQGSLSEGALVTPNLRWEKEKVKNLGLDLNAFKGKLRISADVFNRLRTDILRGRQSIPDYAGVSFGITNYASLKTDGFEIDATYRDKIKDFGFSVNGNVSVAKSTILIADEAIPAEAFYQAQTGGSLGRTLGYVFDGFYTPENIETSVKPSIPVGPGDLRYKDLNDDGIIDALDRMRLPYSNIPNTIFGGNFAMSYKGISMAVTLQAATNFTLRATSTQIVPFTSNLRPIHLDTWTPDNRDAALPRLLPDWRGTVNDPATYISDFWDTRADYLRIKSAELSYTFPSKLTQHILLQGLRVYANGSNLYTWMLKEKNVYNLDPESASGTYIQQYPQQRIWNFGLQVTF